MGCGCESLNGDGKAIVDLVRSKGKDDFKIKFEHIIDCSCGVSFKMETLVDKCPKCNMTYGVTPCSSKDKENIKAAGINY